MLLITGKLILSPTEENEAAIKGLDYVTNTIIACSETRPRGGSKTNITTENSASRIDRL